MIDALDQIADEGRTVEGAAGAPGGPDQQAQQQPGAVDAEQESIAMWAMLPKSVGSALVLALPELAEVYSDENCLAWGASMQNYSRIKGWDVKNAPGALVAMASLPFVLGTAGALLKRLKAAKAAKASQPRSPVTVDNGPQPAASSPAGVNAT